MTIVYDRHIPFLAEAVQSYWSEVHLCPLEPSAIDAAAVRNADAIVIRTRTQVNEALLQGSKVRLVCTATIGFDHIDTAYCDAHGIAWMSCPGCNAQAVCDYIEEVLTHYTRNIKHTPSHMTIGIIGVGHVGSLVAQMAERLGFTILLNDPPKGIGVPLDTIAEQCDIITFHTPLTRSGDYPTYHLCNASFLTKCRRNALIINAARGGIVDEQALLNSGRPFVLDTWENEPSINLQVLRHARLASMHIAGYSTEGKRNATYMCLAAIARHFHLPLIEPSTNHTTPATTNSGWLLRLTEQMKSAFTQPSNIIHQPSNLSQQIADIFESLRKNYPLR